MLPKPALVLIACALSAAACAKANEMQNDRPGPLRPQGDPDLAVQAELDEARRKGSLEAYDLFLARQRQHPLAVTARRERAEIAARRKK